MKRWIAFGVLVAGIWTIQRNPATPSAREMPRTIPVEARVVDVDAEIETSAIAVDARASDEEFRRRRRELYGAMMDRLIASIDWTRADSRVLFPEECALLRAQFECPDE